MHRGPALSEFEKGQLSTMHATGTSQREIARIVGKSKTVVKAYLRNPEGYNTMRRPGRRSSLTPATVRRIVREAQTSQFSSSQIVRTFNLTVSARSVRNILAREDTLRYVKCKSIPMLTKANKLARLECAGEFVTFEEKWESVIFSDEKKFNIDGPDGLQYYWHDLRHEEQVFSNRQPGGGSVMVWGAFSAKGKSRLAILQGKQNSEANVRTLQQHLLPFVQQKHPHGFTSQQDNASIHRSRYTMNWFVEQDMDVMRWPALSPDLNPIENVWGMLTRRVYEGGTQFTSKKELETSILQACDELNYAHIERLLRSMTSRSIAVLELNGSKSPY
uniref:Protein Y6B3B.8 putative n=1 Tax=Albugo laibachii Nc14 TaxID=890382 RepID=F0X263_9STRA|nr:protein Y6B3B.8 putative [Albugo laibachii Nc14]|eukprot:CCA27938.1 protein Y6B3B.8 putative [Albugo laibachii Nc14]